MLTAELTDIRALHERLGKVNSQPINVTSFTNKRFTVNFRVPIQELRRIVPEASSCGASGLEVSSPPRQR